VLAHLLKTAKSLYASKTDIERILYIGDTRLNDGMAFSNICHAGNWPGIAFIAAENREPFKLDTEDQDNTILVTVNRWSALYEIDKFCSLHNFRVDEQTAVLIDLDKTALGARGRNDKVIDRARVQAARQTVSEISGSKFNAEQFISSYSLLNQPEFHSFTADNQDYLVYVCLILGSSIINLESLVHDIRNGRLVSFEHFINQMDDLATQLPKDIKKIHRDLYDRVQQGDPTPFKTFRFNEYLATVELMGNMDEGASVNELLDQEIVITQEVRSAALAWKERGALLFGLSDKPDEASIPSNQLASQGFKPVHQIRTDIVGE
jgi:hypothetical protein